MHNLESASARAVHSSSKPQTTPIQLGNFISPAEGWPPTKIPARLHKENLTHTLVVGDAGSGKTVLLERMAYETTLHWQMKTIIFDFDATWRKLVHAPGLEGHVEVRQLGPGGERPLRWNPLQVSRCMWPETHRRQFRDMFADGLPDGPAAAKVVDALLYDVYVKAGVLVNDPLVLVQHHQDRSGTADLDGYANTRWWMLDSDSEVQAARTAHAERWNPSMSQAHPAEDMVAKLWEPGFPIADLPQAARQAVGRLRSRTVGMSDLQSAAHRMLSGTLPPDQHAVLQAVADRLDALMSGSATAQFAAGPDVQDICEIVPDGWGICILEGGDLMDKASKAFLLGWAGWQLYQDYATTRIEANRLSNPVQFMFDHAHRLFSRGTVMEPRWGSAWRDSRKYGISLHAATRNPAMLPAAMVDVCGCMAAAQLQNRDDRDAVSTHVMRHRAAAHQTLQTSLTNMPRGEFWFEPRGSSLFVGTRLRPSRLHLHSPSDAHLADLLSPRPESH